MKRFIVQVLTEPFVVLPFGLIAIFAISAFMRAPAPRYYWYSVAHTDSIRMLLDRNPGARLTLEGRTKNHIWVGILRGDSAAKVAGSFEVEESFPCPPLCR